MSKLSDFDLDLKFGQEGEALVKELHTSGKTVEVKTDRQWVRTNNLYIETECYHLSCKCWEPSGLAVTKADYWVFVLQKTMVSVPTPILRYAVESFGRPISCDIPPNMSKGYLLTVNDLLIATKENKDD
jgi:hypothetical protein